MLEQFAPLLFFLVVLLLVGVGIYMQQKHAAARRQALAALAADLRWSFDPFLDGSHDDLYAQFEVFRRGHSRYAYNTLEGALTIDGRACPCKMGDFTYKVTSGSGKNRRTTTYYFSYLIMHLPFAGVPALLIRPENLFDKLAGALGFDDIDFESSEFSRKFHVKCSDKRFAYDICHPLMMEWLLGLTPSGVPTIDIERGAMCLTDGSRLWDIDRFRRTMAFAAQFLDRWPDHLTAQLDQRTRSI
jgi:hypothetical protein